jgi:hypothetical protein
MTNSLIHDATIASNTFIPNNTKGHSSSSSEVRAPCASGALGNNTKFAPAFDPLRTKYQLSRNRRYGLLSVSRIVSPKSSRTRNCSCYVGKDSLGKIRDNVSIQKTSNGTRWSGVSVCGSVWACPVCSMRIMMERQQQVMAAMSKHRSRGGSVMMSTITFSHHKFDSLKGTIERFSKALSRMKASRKYKNLKKTIGFKGSIRALEITHGSNGWHPHTHDLIFIDSSLSPSEILAFQESLFDLWLQFCKKYNLGLPTKEHGVKVDFRQDDNCADAIGAYITKWGNEITSSHTKVSKGSSRSPWQILETLSVWNYSDAKLWREYVEAMHGRAMLHWSKGLKDDLGVNDLSDQDIAEGNDGYEVLDELVVTRSEFYAICRLKKQAHVLDRFDISSELASEYIFDLVERDRLNRVTDKEKYKKLEASIYDSTMKAMKRDKLN